MELRRKDPRRASRSVIEAPFVVIGDERRARASTTATHTVDWAVEHLKRDFFACASRANVIDVWLFKARDELRAARAARCSASTPATPYGFYSPEHQALVMNIATGGGTLVHEIVHPFIEANFPAVPAWFNEGLGSLFEQSGERGRAHRGPAPTGASPACKRAIRAGKRAVVRSDDRRQRRASSTRRAPATRRRATSATTSRRRASCTATTTGSARGVAADPTGYKTLVRVLGNPNMEKFEKDWQQWALALETD